ncbi:MAG TPA: sulfate ABC transporter permease subunit CysT [Steroidobacteraceae bacterium]|jgi:sulfate transport system permease protein|nr:sulfate ABC transporter permease subunit CysT [Steroidobacteraceae bacterium]
MNDAVQAFPGPFDGAPAPPQRPTRAMLRRERQFRVLPGFGLTLGYTLFYVSLIVLLPLSAAFVRSAELGPRQFWEVVTTPRVLDSLRLSFGAALLAALINAVFGFIIAWSLTRTRFPGRRILDAMIDLPFALPTAVAGIALTALYAPNGWLGQLLALAGIRVAYTPLGVVVAMAFVSLPFVVRTLQPVLGDLDREVERAAETLGASRLQSFLWVVLPSIWPTLLTGVALGFSRAVGEYGSVIFIAGNIPKVSEIAPLMIMIKLEQYQYSQATAIAVVMLLASFALMFGINGLQLWAQRRRRSR